MTENPFIKTFNDIMFFLKIIMLVLFISYCFSGITLIKPGEIGIVLRFGKITGNNKIDQIREPGWVPAFPYPIDKVVKIPAKMIREIEITELACLKTENDIFEKAIDPLSEGYCITGDRNIVQAVILVKFQITDPVNVIFGFSEKRITLRPLSQYLNDLIISQMTKTIGEFPVDSILSQDKKRISIIIQERVQKKLDEIDAGINLISMEFKELIPPLQAKHSFEAVNSASISRRIVINEAKSYREETIPEAQADSRIILNRAKAYKEKTIAKAMGESTAFLQILSAYDKNPEEVLNQLINTTRSNVFSRLKKFICIPSEKDLPSSIMTIIDNNAKSGNGIYSRTLE